jgi:hypothetical protein
MTQPPDAHRPETLFVRLSSSHLHLVRPDATEPSGYAFFSQRLNPKASLAANLRELARTTPLLQAPPAGQVQVLVNGPATFVPLAEFQEEDCEPLYNFCLPAHNDMQRRVFYDVVAAANVVVLFALSDATCYTLEDLLGMTPHYVSSFTPLIRHFAGKASAKMGHQRFYVYVRERRADIVALEGCRLLHAGSYTIGGIPDVAYFLLSAARNFGARLTTEGLTEGTVGADTFYVAADDDTLREEAIAELRHYAEEVVAVNPSAEFNRHPVTAVPHLPYDLLNLLLEHH